MATATKAAFKLTLLRTEGSEADQNHSLPGVRTGRMSQVKPNHQLLIVLSVKKREPRIISV